MRMSMVSKKKTSKQNRKEEKQTPEDLWCICKSTGERLGKIRLNDGAESGKGKP